jgi:hypothetical protein
VKISGNFLSLNKISMVEDTISFNHFEARYVDLILYL